MRLSFVGITPDTPDSQCPAVFVDEDTGEIAMYAQTFARLAEIAVHGARARELLSALASTT